MIQEESDVRDSKMPCTKGLDGSASAGEGKQEVALQGVTEVQWNAEEDSQLVYKGALAEVPDRICIIRRLYAPLERGKCEQGQRRYL